MLDPAFLSAGRTRFCCTSTPNSAVCVLADGGVVGDGLNRILYAATVVLAAVQRSDLRFALISLLRALTYDFSRLCRRSTVPLS